MLHRLAEQDQRLIGWKVKTRSLPLTAYMAAVPWIKDSSGKDETQARKLAEIARAHFEEGAFGKRETRIACVKGVGMNKVLVTGGGHLLDYRVIKRLNERGTARVRWCFRLRTATPRN